jgi:hypothetical protein
VSDRVESPRPEKHGNATGKQLQLKLNSHRELSKA